MSKTDALARSPFSTHRYSAWLLFAIAILTHSSPLNAQESQRSSDPFANLSLEELTNLEVTSASKKSERYSDVASAIFVLTSEDIRRSGATSIPEALRLVPGLAVARIDGSQWAISSRGFTGVFGDKLLVLIDGRSVYTPLFGGVFWNEQDTILEDIERIEVIRGPGATLYGANAVNGVINIITKHARDTHGVLASAGTGSIERYSADIRYGDRVADTDYRLYAKYFNRDEQVLEDGGHSHDTWRGVRSGFRTDTRLDTENTATVQGDVYYGESGWDFIEPTLQGTREERPETKYINGANTVMRWKHEISDRSEITAQAYYDHIGRDDQVLVQKRDTWDLDLQHRVGLNRTHELLYGGEYRIYRDSIDGSFSADVEPEERTLELFTGFVQDEITLVPERWKFIVGSKLEHNELSGLEVLPSARLLYTPNEQNSFWGAVSRGVRSPARFNQDGRLVLQTIPGENGLTNVVSLSGVDSYDSEYVMTYELGYRAQLAESVALDIATFYSNYDDLESAEPYGSPFLNSYEGTPYVDIPFAVQNLLEGTTFGGEIVVDWRPLEQWRLVTSYSYINIDLRRTQGSQDQIFMAGEEQYPSHQAMVRSLFNVTPNVEFDTTLRYVASIDTFDVDDYIELDTRLGWRFTERWEASVVGQNLLHDDHFEFTSNLVDTSRTSIQRGVYGKITYRF